jgi:hypothetical protein
MSVGCYHERREGSGFKPHRDWEGFLSAGLFGTTRTGGYGYSSRYDSAYSRTRRT